MARLPDRVVAFRGARTWTDLKRLDDGVRRFGPRLLGECLK